jgi:hypothetical protein
LDVRPSGAAKTECDDSRVNRYEGPARLEWWANPVTCLGSVEVVVVVQVAADGWAGHASLVDEEDREGLDFLCELDPLFSLRFGDGRTADVTVGERADNGRFLLAAFPADGRTARKSGRPVA